MAPSPLESSKAYGQVFETGLKTRREVVGDAYVNGALEKGATQFARPMQELVTSWCWGDVWNRPGLERKQRSLLSKFCHICDTTQRGSS
jgi:4-carboxymuconolactone decarboxylase